MRWKPMITLLAAAMVLAFVLPWIDTPLGSLSPRQALDGFDRERLAEAPPLLLAFLASFVLPGLLALVSLAGWTPRALVLVTGLLPVAIAAYVALDARGRLRDLGLPLPGAGDLGAFADGLREVAGLGLYLYAAAALLLLLLGLLQSGR